MDMLRLFKVGYVRSGFNKVGNRDANPRYIKFHPADPCNPCWGDGRGRRVERAHAPPLDSGRVNDAAATHCFSGWADKWTRLTRSSVVTYWFHGLTRWYLPRGRARSRITPPVNCPVGLSNTLHPTVHAGPTTPPPPTRHQSPMITVSFTRRGTCHPQSYDPMNWLL